MAKITTQSVENRLQQVVTETSGTALTISPKDGEWSGYLLQQKKSFSEKTFPELCEAIIKHIEEARDETPGSKKPFKYRK